MRAAASGQVEGRGPAPSSRPPEPADSAAVSDGSDAGPQEEPTRPGDVTYERFLFESAPGQRPSRVDAASPGGVAPRPRRWQGNSLTLLGVAAAASAIGGALGSAMVMLLSRGSPAGPAPVGSNRAPTASIVAPTPAPSAGTEHALSLASAELKRLRMLLPEQRTAAEALALARYQRSERAAELAQLGEEMTRNQAVARDLVRLRKLEEYAADPVTAFDALTIMAALPGPESADLLYRTWVGRPERTEVTSLAAALVYSQEVQRKASEPLRVALDLRKAQECEEYASILPRAKEKGDWRSLRVLADLMRYRMGCGPTKTGDCHACLHHSKALGQAIAAVRERPSPKY
jgi:hypothetical protein